MLLTLVGQLGGSKENVFNILNLIMEMVYVVLYPERFIADSPTAEKQKVPKNSFLSFTLMFISLPKMSAESTMELVSLQVK